MMQWVFSLRFLLDEAVHSLWGFNKNCLFPISLKNFVYKTDQNNIPKQCKHFSFFYNTIRGNEGETNDWNPNINLTLNTFPTDYNLMNFDFAMIIKSPLFVQRVREEIAEINNEMKFAIATEFVTEQLFWFFSPNKQFLPFLFLLINKKTLDKRTDTINPVWWGIFRNTTPLNVRLKLKYQICAALRYLTMFLILFIQHFLLSGSWHVLSLFQDLKIIKFSQIFPLICFIYFSRLFILLGFQRSASFLYFSCLSFSLFQIQTNYGTQSRRTWKEGDVYNEMKKNWWKSLNLFS